MRTGTLAILVSLSLVGCASSVPDETEDQAKTRRLCDVLSDAVRISAEKRDEGYTEEQLIATARQFPNTEPVVKIIRMVYDDGAKASPKQLRAMYRHECMHRLYRPRS